MTARKLIILVTALSIGTAVSGASSGRTAVLREGFILNRTDGKLVRADSGPEAEEKGDEWVFEFGSEVGNGRVRLEAGTKLEVLPSAALERMLAEMEVRSVSNFRLWGRLTRYKGENFIFPTRFLPISQISQGQPAKAKEGEPREGEPNEAPASKKGRQEPPISEANDVLKVPEEIMERLKTDGAARIKRRRQVRQTLKSGGEDSDSLKDSRTKPDRPQKAEAALDAVLIDRIGFMQERGRKGLSKQGQADFVLDAFGRKLAGGSFVLLPCEALERAEHRQAAGLDRLRFKIAGIVTNYKGRRYLLLQKAIPVYSHGNFPR
ncbi:MAG: hypothetical protein ACYTEQ_13640 [Planctomycetota bacterium]|jgi:hypothetical protein